MNLPRKPKRAFFMKFSPTCINPPHVPSINMMANSITGGTPARMQIDVRIISAEQSHLMGEIVIDEVSKFPDNITIDEPVPGEGNRQQRVW